MQFTPWTLFTDVGIIAILLLVGTLLRAKVKLFQRYFIPPSLIAGFLGLALGSQGLNWLPLSDNLSTYASILIAFIFGCLPFTSRKNSKKNATNISKMWAYSQTGMLWQWAAGGFFGILVLEAFWPLDPSFGLSLPSGFVGGHGTAAAIGHAFQKFNNDEMMSLAMTSATVGILSAVFVGLALIKWGTKKGYTTFLPDFSLLPHELRTGLLPVGKRVSLGDSTISSISIDSLAFNLCVIIMVALGGYGMNRGLSLVCPQFEMPVFSCAFIFCILVNTVLRHFHATDYLSQPLIGHMSGTFTDFLVAFGISSIKLSVVLKYILPLTLLLSFGLVVTLFYVFFVARRMFQVNWFEKALFTWGWFTGTMAMGIALLRVVDPEMKSHCLDDYALAYIFIAPIEICLITFAPVAFVNGYGLLFLTVSFLLGLAIMVFSYFKGWLRFT
jgi:ESS family glutamate:Na+ symporter